MTKSVTPEAIETGVRRALVALRQESSLLNELDAHLGDGDLGMTVEAVATAILQDEESDGAAEVGVAFERIARAIARSSGSSLSAMAMGALKKLARETAGRTALSFVEFGALMRSSAELMMTMGGARPGDKSVVDSLLAIAGALEKFTDQESSSADILHALDASIVELRGKPSRIGRGRLAGERGIGHDDPGMIACRIIVASLADSGETATCRQPEETGLNRKNDPV